jgi:hypothetical protein
MAIKSTAGASRERYEKRDANIRGLICFAALLLVSLVLILLFSKWMFGYFAETQPLGPPTTPFENVRTLPSGPRLQVKPRHDLDEYRQSQSASLDSYGWVDRQNGVVRIPIDRAMDLLLERGLPTRSSDQQNEGAQSAGTRSGAGNTGRPGRGR